jgi:hypothetical protein
MTGKSDAGVEENFVYGGGHIVQFTDGKVSEIVEARWRSTKKR